MRPLCIIPARASSKRFPRKNIALLNGKPLLVYVIEAAQKSEIFDRVCVSTEDEEIHRIAEEAGAEVLKRPSELAEDIARVPHVCTQVLKHYADQGNSYEAFGVILPTSPLVAAEDLQKSYEIFTSAKDANYVASFVQYSEPPQHAYCVKGDYVECFFAPEGGVVVKDRSQMLEKLYYIDGSIIFSKTDVFLREGDFCGSKTAPYFIPKERSSDIDEPIELAWAEFRLQNSTHPE